MELDEWQVNIKTGQMVEIVRGQHDGAVGMIYSVLKNCQDEPMAFLVKVRGAGQKPIEYHWSEIKLKEGQDED